MTADGELVEPAGQSGSQGKAGLMIVVVGPSGAGKDSVMNYAARHVAPAGDGGPRFARRVITRAADAGGEQHDSVGEEEFQRLKQAGAFAVSWDAHGLSYGIPAAELDAVRDGCLVVANGSRSALSRFVAVFPRLLVVTVTARSEILAERLAARGRETTEAIAARLRHKPDMRPDMPLGGFESVVIDNSGPLEQAGAAFVRLLQDRRFGRK